MTLKTKNMPLLIGYAVLLYIGFSIANEFNWDIIKTIKISKSGIEFPNPLLNILMYIIAIILDSIIPSEFKHKIIYLRWDYPLPGCRIFSDIIKDDPRISINDLIKKYGKLPSKPEEQNRLWYKIYLKNQNDKVVNSSHQFWLLLRDLFSISLLLFFPTSIYTIISASLFNTLSYIILYLILLILLWISARNLGNRFACNVLSR